MGQYHLVVNLDRREFIHPHKFGDGLKLLEFGSSGSGTMTGLAILLACSNDRGGGDLHITDEDRGAIVGTWAGDRVAIVGDYAEDDDLAPEHGAGSIYGRTHECDGRIRRDGNGGSIQYPATCGRREDHEAHGPEYRDISEEVLAAMAQDHYLASDLAQRSAVGFG